MTGYRMYFLVADRITGREDFDAADDVAALSIARILCEACSDICQSFELWQGTRRLRARQPPYRRATALADLDDAGQRAAIETEEAIARSQWRIAQSERLFARLKAVRSSARYL